MLSFKILRHILQIVEQIFLTSANSVVDNKFNQNDGSTTQNCREGKGNDALGCFVALLAVGQQQRAPRRIASSRIGRITSRKHKQGKVTVAAYVLPSCCASLELELEPECEINFRAIRRWFVQFVQSRRGRRTGTGPGRGAERLWLINVVLGRACFAPVPGCTGAISLSEL